MKYQGRPRAYNKVWCRPVMSSYLTSRTGANIFIVMQGRGGEGGGRVRMEMLTVMFCGLERKREMRLNVKIEEDC